MRLSDYMIIALIVICIAQQVALGVMVKSLIALNESFKTLAEIALDVARRSNYGEG